VLVTSNGHAWCGAGAPVEIQLCPTEIGVDYLIVRCGRCGLHVGIVVRLARARDSDDRAKLVNTGSFRLADAASDTAAA